MVVDLNCRPLFILNPLLVLARDAKPEMAVKSGRRGINQRAIYLFLERGHRVPAKMTQKMAALKFRQNTGEVRQGMLELEPLKRDKAYKTKIRKHLSSVSLLSLCEGLNVLLLVAPSNNFVCQWTSSVQNLGTSYTLSVKQRQLCSKSYKYGDKGLEQQSILRGE